MTLTLEQVRQTRFHLARRNGYEPVDVDNFVDQVEATLEQLTKEISSLKEQLEAAPAGAPASIFVPGDTAAEEKVRQEIEDLRAQLQQRSEEISQRDSDLAQARSALAAAQAQTEALQAQVEESRRVAEEAQTVGSDGKVDTIVVSSSAEASPAVTRLLEMATVQADKLIAETQVEANTIIATARGEAGILIDEANRKSQETLSDARTRADRIESEARVNAEQLTAEAQQRAAAITSEAETARSKIFVALEQERDILRGKVGHLRSFESAFRANLENHLQSQLKALSEAQFEPSDVPSILTEATPAASTPRLDALLGDDN